MTYVAISLRGNESWTLKQQIRRVLTRLNFGAGEDSSESHGQPRKDDLMMLPSLNNEPSAGK